MLFNSYIFIFAFLPICIVGFYLLKGVNPIGAKLFLTAMSLWFYGYFNIRYLAIMLFSIAFNYVIFRLMESRTAKKHILILGIIANLSVLFYFKYYDFFIESCNALFKTEMPLKGILLPLGISFFTFQQIGFLADAYRGEIKECKFYDYALFVSFFPQLIAGPVVNHNEMLPQFNKIGRKITSEEIARGVYIFILGLGKKVLLADTLAHSVSWAYNLPMGEIKAVEAVLTVLFYSLQLYFDFSGYCDMAMGLAMMLGVKLPLNFNSPYKAVNIVDFWKRWHITLGRFFTKNIYIPLGGNRHGKGRMCLNFLIVFFLSGLWHGAGWNFIFWGIIHGILYVITKMSENVFNRSGRALNKSAYKNERAALCVNKVSTIIGRILTFAYVSLAWVYFRAPSVKYANHMLLSIVNTEWTAPAKAFVDGFNLPEFWYALKVLHLADFSFSIYIIMICFTIFSLILVFCGKNTYELSENTAFKVPTAIMLAVIFVWCVVSLSGVSTFLYFNF